MNMMHHVHDVRWYDTRFRRLQIISTRKDEIAFWSNLNARADRGPGGSFDDAVGDDDDAQRAA